MRFHASICTMTHLHTISLDFTLPANSRTYINTPTITATDITLNSRKRTMADLNIYLTTFNCGRASINIDYFSNFLFDALSGPHPLPPDLIVLSLQEIAPIGYSFLGGSLLTPYFSRFTQAVADATRNKFPAGDVVYHEPLVRKAGMTSIMVFAKEEIWHRVHGVDSAGVGVGLWEMGNKGAVGVRLALGGSGDEDALLTFVAAHLAPMESEWERRNQDWKSICEGLVFESEEHEKRASGVGEREPLLSKQSTATNNTLFNPPTHLFFLGDLNYRAADTAPHSDSHPTWPQPVSDPSDPRHPTHHLQNDQLHREQSQNHTLHNLSEASITFPPTYKYSRTAQNQATHSIKTIAQKQADGRTNMVTQVVRPNERAGDDDDDSEEVWKWAQHRVPSWCDRILFLAAAKPDVKAYEALPVQPTSDHRPVVLSCAVARRRVEAGAVQAPFAVRGDWRERRAAARRLEVVVGVLAYLGLTWEGRALVFGTVVGLVGGSLALRALLAM